jgi:hypothetical protein
MVEDRMRPTSLLPFLSNPPRPGLYAIQGPSDLVPWALQVMTLTFSPSPIVWIDAANKFNAHGVAMNARAHHQDPNTVLRAYHVARPFTAYQLEMMVTQKLLPAAFRYRALFSVIADPLSLYEGAEGRDTQLDQSFRRFIDGLSEAAIHAPIVALIPEPVPRRYYGALLQITSRIRLLES